jgi:hypothetical protein
MANIFTYLRQKLLILVASGSGEKNFFPHFFNITPMGEKLTSRNHLTPDPD